MYVTLESARKTASVRGRQAGVGPRKLDGPTGWGSMRRKSAPLCGLANGCAVHTEPPPGSSLAGVPTRRFALRPAVQWCSRTYPVCQRNAQRAHGARGECVGADLAAQPSQHNGGRRTLGRHGDYRLRVGVSAKGRRALPPAQAMTAQDEVANDGSGWRSRQQGRAAGGRPNPSTGPWRTVCGGSRPRPASPHRPCADCLRWP